MATTRTTPRAAAERNVSIEIGPITLNGILALPKEQSGGIVLFAHGSGSSRLSPRNQYVAHVLQSQGIATLLFDLLTEKEEAVDQYTAELRFDIGLLGKRLVGATRWAMKQPEMGKLKIGYFGASTGAAAALVAAAELPEAISAVVSRGGRPDLAADALGVVRAPTLLIVGGEDGPVIGMNEEAMAKMRRAEKELLIIPGATHLFEEPGMLEEVARAAAEWFGQHLACAERARPRSCHMKVG